MKYVAATQRDQYVNGNGPAVLFQQVTQRAHKRPGSGSLLDVETWMGEQDEQMAHPGSTDKIRVGASGLFTFGRVYTNDAGDTVTEVQAVALVPYPR